MRVPINYLLNKIATKKGFTRKHPNDTNWLFFNNDAKGGIKVVATLQELYQIPVAFLEVGLTAAYITTNPPQLFTLNSLPADAEPETLTASTNWLPFNFAGQIEGGIKYKDNFDPSSYDGGSATIKDSEDVPSGTFYVVINAPGSAPVTIEDPAIFNGEPTTLTNNDWVIYDGDRYRVIQQPESAELVWGGFTGDITNQEDLITYLQTNFVGITNFNSFVEEVEQALAALDEKQFSFEELTGSPEDNISFVAYIENTLENYLTLEDYEEGRYYKGLYTTLINLQIAHPTSTAGSFADVDQGEGFDAIRYIWDVSDGKWVTQIGTGSVVLPPPTNPVILNIESTQALFDWSPVNNAIGYNVYRSGTKVNSEIITDTQFLLTGLPSNSSIGVSVVAVSSTNNESTGAGPNPFITKPAKVVGVTAIANSDSEVALDWTAVSGLGVVTYNVYRGTVSNTLTLIASSVSSSDYLDTGLNETTEYFYKIEAENITGKGVLSDEVSETTETIEIGVKPTITNHTITQNGIQIEGEYTYVSSSNTLENNKPPQALNVRIEGQTFIDEVITVLFDFYSESGYDYDAVNTVLRLYKVEEEGESPILVETLESNTFTITSSEIGFKLIASVIVAQSAASPANGNPLSAETFSNLTDVVQTAFNPDVLFDSYYRVENKGATWINTGFGTGSSASSIVGNAPIINNEDNRVDFEGNQWFTMTSPGNSNGIPYVVAFRFSKTSATNIRLIEFGLSNSFEFRGNGKLRFDSSATFETTFLFQTNTDYILITEHTMNITNDIIVSVYNNEGTLISTEIVEGGTKSPRGLNGTIGSDDGVSPFIGWLKELGVKIGTISSNDKENIINRLVSLT